MNAPHVPDAPRDELGDLIASTLRSRQPADAWVAATTDRLAADLLASGAAEGGAPGMGHVVPFRPRVGRIAVTGVATSALVVGAGVAAAAANPFSGFAAGVEQAAAAVGVEWSFMPAGYTREQYTALWSSDYSAADVATLQQLWNLDVTATKARIGQALIDGTALPIAPGTQAEASADSAEQEADCVAAIEAGYSDADVDKLSDLWNVDFVEAKAKAGAMILQGDAAKVPVPPSGTETTAGR